MAEKTVQEKDGVVSKPDWWPQNPYPESVFPTTIEEYVEFIPDTHNRSAISGCLGRYFWNICQDEIWKRFCEHLKDKELGGGTQDPSANDCSTGEPDEVGKGRTTKELYIVMNNEVVSKGR